MSEPSGRPLAPSLALSGTPAVPLRNSFALFASGTAFVFWDLCGIEFCILKVLPTGTEHMCNARDGSLYSKKDGWNYKLMQIGFSYRTVYMFVVPPFVN